MGYFIRAGLCAALALSVAAFADPPAQSQTKTYEQWVALAEAGDATVDFTALRLAYVQSPGYDGYSAGQMETRQAFIKAANTRECAKSAPLADLLLKIDYTYPWPIWCAPTASRCRATVPRPSRNMPSSTACRTRS